jgi:hypothetical protein
MRFTLDNIEYNVTIRLRKKINNKGEVISMDRKKEIRTQENSRPEITREDREGQAVKGALLRLLLR